ncbi:hypothetical protein [Microbacterium schleiferi]|uniref:SPOR domain-containing protein n=1 Tax=Microbacterium schleiferi TaxID=69362 RepID=A0ABU7V6I2_9MICO
MPAFRSPAAALASAVLAALLLAGCATDGADADATEGPVATAEAAAADASGSDEAVDETDSEPDGERPEGLDASLPVPPGTLVSATPETSAWEYIYSGVTSDEARAFAESLKEMGFEQKITVDSEGVEQWYLQSANWAIKLEETHADESLRYWVDPISE